MKTFAFEIGYGQFSNPLFWGEQNLEFCLAHRQGIELRAQGMYESMFVYMVAGITPRTYYSGNREYGKLIFSVPDDVIVVKTHMPGASNLEAFAENRSFLKLDSHGASSTGFDFYIKDNYIPADARLQVRFETLQKLTGITPISGVHMPDKLFIQNAMPYNLSEIIPDFPYQTSGWRRNEGETHLFAITGVTLEDESLVNCWIPFAANKDNISMPGKDDISKPGGVCWRYVKEIIPAPESEAIQIPKPWEGNRGTIRKRISEEEINSVE